LLNPVGSDGRRRRGVSGGLRWGILVATCGEEARPGGNFWRQSSEMALCRRRIGGDAKQGRGGGGGEGKG
jgi:hypothetical protein